MQPKTYCECFLVVAGRFAGRLLHALRESLNWWSATDKNGLDVEKALIAPKPHLDGGWGAGRPNVAVEGVA